MLFSGKENIFMCLVAFQKMFRKIFSGAWLCSWKYHRKHIFYLLLTFSRLPNKYIISFIPQYKNTNKTQKKKYHQIRSNWEKKEEREALGFDKRRDRAAWFCDRDWRKGEITIGAMLQRSDPIQKGEGDWEKERSTVRTWRHDLAAASVSRSLSLFLPLRVCELLSLRVLVPKVIWR